MKLRPVLAAAGLLVSGLALTSPVLACPGAKKASPPAVAAHSECAYASARATESCCSSFGFGSRLLAAGVPAGLVAFGLGWLTGGRRRRDSAQA